MNTFFFAHLWLICANTKGKAHYFLIICNYSVQNFVSLKEICTFAADFEREEATRENIGL